VRDEVKQTRDDKASQQSVATKRLNKVFKQRVQAKGESIMKSNHRVNDCVAGLSQGRETCLRSKRASAKSVGSSIPLGRALRRVFQLAVLLLPWGVLSNSSADQSAIHQMLDQFHERASQADFEGYFGLYHPEAVFIGTDAEERWDLEAFKAYAKPHFDEGKGWTYRVLERHLAGEGEIRWFDELLWNDWLGPCRGSGVIARVNGEWRVRHYVLSLAVPNEIAAAVGEQAISVDQSLAPAEASSGAPD
jgi:hypothetical protein